MKKVSFLMAVCLSAILGSVHAAQPAGGNKYLGERIIEMAEDDARVSPSPLAAKNSFKECKFKTLDPVTYGTRDCLVKNTAPGRKSDRVVIFPLTARCCTSALQIIPLKYDPDGAGLDLFSGLPGVKKTKLSCPNIDGENMASTGSEIYLIEKDNKAKFVIREDYSSGSGGTGRYTTIYFTKLKADKANCAEFAQTEKDLNEQWTQVFPR
jgi:hypothetical protein